MGRALIRDNMIIKSSVISNYLSRGSEVSLLENFHVFAENETASAVAAFATAAAHAPAPEAAAAAAAAAADIERGALPGAAAARQKLG